MNQGSSLPILCGFWELGWGPEQLQAGGAKGAGQEGGWGPSTSKSSIPGSAVGRGLPGAARVAEETPAPRGPSFCILTSTPGLCKKRGEGCGGRSQDPKLCPHTGDGLLRGDRRAPSVTTWSHSRLGHFSMASVWASNWGMVLVSPCATHGRSRALRPRFRERVDGFVPHRLSQSHSHSHTVSLTHNHTHAHSNNRNHTVTFPYTYAQSTHTYTPAQSLMHTYSQS